MCKIVEVALTYVWQSDSLLRLAEKVAANLNYGGNFEVAVNKRRKEKGGDIQYSTSIYPLLKKTFGFFSCSYSVQTVLLYCNLQV